MARTLDEIRASAPKIDRARIDATTEEDIQRYKVEDGEDLDAPTPDFKLVRRRPGQRGAGMKRPKAQLTLRLDPAALEAWRASGKGWQTRIGELVAREAPTTKRL